MEWQNYFDLERKTEFEPKSRTEKISGSSKERAWPLSQHAPIADRIARSNFTQASRKACRMLSLDSLQASWR